jgi:membrane-associated protease RseP (regulator of RpoE activity)
MSHRAPQTAMQMAASLALTLAIFAVPLWTVTAVPSVDTFDAASTEEHRVTVWMEEVPSIEAPAELEEPPAEPPVEAEPEAAPLAHLAPPPVAPAAAAQPSSPTVPAETAPPSPAQSRETVPAERVAKAPKKKPRRRRDCHPDVPEIEATGPHHWSVDRDLVDHYARDLRAAEKLALVSWAHDDNDRVIGFRVVRVRCGSPLHEAGFQNGDVITQINGHKVRTVPQALAAYVALRIKRKLRVRGMRKDGTPLDHRYRLT